LSRSVRYATEGEAAAGAGPCRSRRSASRLARTDAACASARTSGVTVSEPPGATRFVAPAYICAFCAASAADAEEELRQRATTLSSGPSSPSDFHHFSLQGAR
jgi:hypothetical protein